MLNAHRTSSQIRSVNQYLRRMEGVKTDSILVCPDQMRDTANLIYLAERYDNQENIIKKICFFGCNREKNSFLLPLSYNKKLDEK